MLARLSIRLELCKAIGEQAAYVSKVTDDTFATLPKLEKEVSLTNL